MMAISALGKDLLVFDQTSPDDGDNVGAYIRSSDGTLITHSTDGAKECLDVSICNTADFGLYDEDSVHTSGDKGQFMLGVRHDADTSLVDADGDYAPLQLDEQGRLKVIADLDVDFDYVFAEDSTHTTGDLGSHSLNVRKDTLSASTDADGDYASFLSNGRGALWTAPVGTAADGAADDESPVKIGFRAMSTLSAVDANDRADGITDLYRRQWVNDSADIAATHVALSVDDTIGGTQLKVSALACRRNIMVQNLDNKAIYIGLTGVTAADGMRLGAGASMMLDVGPNIDLYAIGDSAGADVRIMELG
jgi:hypothetical protein